MNEEMTAPGTAPGQVPSCGYADVIIDISHERVDHPFTYRIPPELAGKITEGSAVTVPFGQGDTLRKAYVIGFRDRPGMAPERIKSIREVIDRDLPAEAVLIRLAAWMKKTYDSTMIAALKTVLPASRRVKLREKKQARESGAEQLHDGPGEAPDTAETALSDEQQRVVDSLLSDFDNGVRKSYLVCGITGSGKTEVYIRCIEEMIKRGRQAIVLIPEIALTWQTYRRFANRFGDRVSIMNSTLSGGEKFDHFDRARRGEIDIIIGPRSALFTPFPNPGLIIIDEEHESSYKSENMPKYHARETAEALAGMVPGGASVLMGSATPSMEALHLAATGEYGFFRLTKRLTGGTLPDVEITDLREELRAGNRTPFSRSLTERMNECLEKGEQAMLFINRRGMAGFVSCRSCGYVYKCPHCDVSLSSHSGRRLICHYCGHEETMQKVCPSCGSKYVSSFKAGTEAIEIHAKRLFPEARILRMDADTTRRKGSYEEILSTFSRGDADILIGTQMIVKGHDFPKVTLVGILAADLSLNTGDYRAAERTWQLLVQAAGRAGRGDLPGHVVIQTYQPEHYAVRLAARQDLDAFFKEEMRYRAMMQYPPAGHLLAVQIFAKDEEEAAGFARQIGELIERATAEDGTTRVIGPAPAMIGRINDVYRYGLYLKSRDRERLRELGAMAEAELMIERQRGERKQVMLQFDFDPVRGF